MREIAPTIPLVLFATLREQMDAALGSQRAFTFLSAFFAGVALLLSAIGPQVSQHRFRLGRGRPMIEQNQGLHRRRRSRQLQPEH